MDLLSFLVFGIIAGILVHWIHPENKNGGFLGAALTGGSGAIIGASTAILILQSVLQLTFLPILIMLGAIFFLGLLLFSSIRITDK
jgi:uncharacterized membrane protein YeaQ/YmgE (transglycosylase-associated protein family)